VLNVLLAPPKRRSYNARHLDPEFSTFVRLLEKWGISCRWTVAAPALFQALKHTPSSSSPPSSSNIKRKIQQYWQNSPCDSWFTDEPRGTVAFYQSLDEHRYKVHQRLQAAVGFERTRGLRVLEIGCGCGSEAERFARAGAHYTAADLTDAALAITRQRFQLANLQGHFVQGRCGELAVR
jgi:Methyltransferase domain